MQVLLSLSMVLAENQPEPGDVVLHCGHRDAANHHWWHWPKLMRFSRGDGTHGKAKWLMVCVKCFDDAGQNVVKVYVRGDYVVNDPPTIEDVWAVSPYA